MRETVQLQDNPRWTTGKKKKQNRYYESFASYTLKASIHKVIQLDDAATAAICANSRSCGNQSFFLTYLTIHLTFDWQTRQMRNPTRMQPLPSS